MTRLQDACENDPMIPVRSALIIAALVALVSGDKTQAEALAPERHTALQLELDLLVAESAAPGVLLLVGRGGRIIHQASAGRIDPDAPLAVASASKWMAATLILMLVDEGLLDLDEPIGRRLPEYQGPAGEITLRQLLSYTAGQGSLLDLADVRLAPDITLRQAAGELALRPLQDPPGETFRYGGPSFQVAGALAEQATGQGWHELFRTRLAEPLGLSHSAWHAFGRGPLDPGVRNPNLQAGLITTAGDYMRFLALLSGEGVVNGRRLLSGSAIEALTYAHTTGLAMGFTPPGVGSSRIEYALGSWCEVHDSAGRCDVLSSPGMFGTYPWIDRETGLYGIFFLRDRLPLVVDHIRRARQLVRKIDEAGGFSGQEAYLANNGGPHKGR
jgi:CubicO group peptidase (beta-lactamase class C family)